ncbi:endonuclease [Colwellia sp. C1TZA3]|uniref:endonuclease n=1 Tax=Colwellia sp. C1TZA3 TaxID=2508879 RepID=UPI0011BA23A5|nr:endonuclease [Colwellia sp. C1TZA3]TWX64892.1 endonuclease I [Colwellia sp. C1TZA3]
MFLNIPNTPIKNKVHLLKHNRKILLTLLTLLSNLSFVTNAEVLNGNFEAWSNASADHWTTVDSGLSVSQNTTRVKTGSNSAVITVNTGTQSSTDFLQNIAVTAGQSYDFSVWLYHTEGGLKGRLYADGYQGYSKPNLVNQWQQITYTYTASTTKEIAVGLRFYDTSGFDGAETVYIDDFQPTVSAGTGGDSVCSNHDVTFSLTTDQYGAETSWTITNSNNTEQASGNNYSNATSYSENICLLDGDYTFTINDSYGDGICCNQGSGSYDISLAGTSLASGANFTYTESKSFPLSSGQDTGSNVGTGGDPGNYYQNISTQTGYTLKTDLHDLIKNHSAQGYGAIWTFYANHSLDTYFENDSSILDIYSEKPFGSDSYSYTKVTDQCGNYSGEGGCYNREHSFPKSWFGGKIEPMNSDIHHIFATDGYVNSKRGSYPYGEVASTTFTSSNNAKLGTATTALGYSGTVFEPIDEFKGDLARAHLYMATRYEDVISNWQKNSTYSNAILDGSNNKVFETWQLDMLLRWHANDPVSQKEIDRNEAAYSHQGNRNPFIDHPEYVDKIWSAN